jgi:hypothetical protein
VDRLENDRQYRVVDQTLSMHAYLRDRYKRRAFVLNFGLMATSITLCAFVFASDDVLSVIGITPMATKFGVGIASVLSLILSIMETRVDWDAVSCRHGDAAGRLGELKAKFRKLHAVTQGNDPKKNQSLGREYERAMRELPPIPHSMFNSLKAEHLYKTLLSQRISLCPKTPVWFLRLKLRWEGIREASKGVASHASSQTPPANQTTP